MSIPSSHYTFGQKPRSWGEGSAKNISFIVTEDCQLRCCYCYLSGKNRAHPMSFDIARRTVDYVLANQRFFPESSVEWAFIGGEPLLEIELIDAVCDYIKRRMYEENHPWFDSYRFSLSTNGILYDHPRVQDFIAKNRAHLSIGISLDGTQRKHDLQRRYPDGRGSYGDVVRNVPRWLEQFPGAGTKVTVGHEDLPFVFESVVHLWDLGIPNVFINTVFENVWVEGDDAVLEEQLKSLADHVLAKGLFNTVAATFFSDSIGLPLDAEQDTQNWCGAGKMLAVDHAGLFYPCIRFAPYSLARHPARTVGSCFEGIDQNRLRPFLTLDRMHQSPQKCLACEVASGCAWCQGLNYDAADTETIYQRAVFICAMHKARVRANRYYWKMFAKLPPVGEELPAAAAPEGASP